MCNQGGPGKSARFFCVQSCQMCHTFGRGILCCYQFLLEEVSCILENILCEVYVVKVWEGMVQNSCSCHTIPKALLALWNLCSSFCCTLPSIIVCLKILLLESSNLSYMFNHLETEIVQD